MVEDDLIAVWWRTFLREAVWARGLGLGPESRLPK
jgi:hypothetical protein